MKLSVVLDPCPCVQKVTVHISGTTDRLLSAAELMELKKEDTDGLLREISMDDIKHFKNSGLSVGRAASSHLFVVLLHFELSVTS